MKTFERFKTASENLYDRYAIFLLCAAVIFFRLPPLQIIPGGGPLLQTHNFVRVIVLVLFFATIFVKKNSRTNKVDRISLILVALYFITQSLSIIPVSNTGAFLSVYKDIFVSVLLFYVTAQLITGMKNLRYVSLALVLATAVNIVFQLATYFFPFFVSSYLSPFLYEKYWQFFSYQIGRNRYFGDSFDEILVPLLLANLSTQKKHFNKLPALALMGAIIFITYISNWRTKVLILLAVTMWSFFTLVYKVKYKILLTGAILAIVAAANATSLSTLGFSIYDRFLLDDSIQTQSITGRFTYWKQAFEMGMENPVFGVGLGNYFDNLPQQSKTQNMKSILDRTIVIDDPHNIFFSTLATSGVIGLISLVVVLGYFVLYDINNFHSSKKYFIIMFWGLFVFALLNPFQYAAYLYLFWFLRGVIAGSIDT